MCDGCRILCVMIIMAVMSTVIVCYTYKTKYIGSRLAYIAKGKRKDFDQLWEPYMNIMWIEM